MTTGTISPLTKPLVTEQDHRQKGTHSRNIKGGRVDTCCVRLGHTTFSVKTSDIKEDKTGKYFTTATGERAEWVSDDPKAKLTPEQNEELGVKPGSKPDKTADDHSPPEEEPIQATADAKDLIRDNSLDASLITGTGHKGKITKGDVEKHLAENE